MLGLVLLEGVARVWDYVKHGTTRLGGKPVGLWQDEAAPGEGPRLAPNVRLDGFGHELAVNSHGFRGPELMTPEPNPGYRVWAVGGSTTFDICVTEDAAAWPAQLQVRLTEAYPGLTVEVINAGIPGGTLSQNRADLQRLGPQLGAELLLIHHGPNDLRNIASTLWPFPAVGGGAMHGLALFRLLSDLVPPPRAPDDWAERRVTRDQLEPLRGEVQQLIDLGRGQGMSVMIASHALAASAEDSSTRAWWEVGRTAYSYGMPPQGMIASYATMNQLFEDMAAEQGLPYCELAGEVPAESRYWHDGIHFTDDGAALAGEVVAGCIERAGLIQR